MSKLPDYTALGQRPVPDVPLRGSASVQLPHDSFGQSMQIAGHDLEAASAIVQQTNLRQDTIAAEAALNRLHEQRINLEFDDKTGFRSVKEGGAVGQTFIDGYMGRFDSGAAQISDGLANDQQRALFKQRVPIVGLQYRSSLLQHQAHQTELFNDQTEKGTVDLELRNIAQHPDNDLSFQTGLTRIEGTLRSAGDRKGEPAQAIDVEIAQKRDAAYMTRILAMAEGVPGVMQADPYRAKALFESAQSKLGPKLQVELSAHINAAVGRANDSAAGIAIQKDAPGVFDLTGKALGIAGSSQQPDPNAPRGIRNNNPGNIRTGTSQWEGQVASTDAAYVAFESPQAGVRAMTKNLLSYQEQGLNTIHGIANRWAPPSENDTGAYVASLSKQLGVKPDEALDLHDPAVMQRLTAAIIQQENGSNPYQPETIKAGVMAGYGLSRLNPQQDPPFTGPAAPSNDLFTGQRVKTGSDFIDSAPTAELLRWRQQAHTEMQRTQATARSSLQERIHDVQAMTLSGVVPPMESIPTMRDYAAAGLDAHRYSEDIADYLRIGGGIKALQTASAGERTTILQRFQPPEGDGFSHQQKLFSSLVEANKIVEKKILTDPATYAMTYAPKVMDAQAAMMNVLNDKNATDVDRKAAVSRYATETIAEQQRLGVNTIKAEVLGEGAKKRQPGPRLLTNGQANSIAAQFASNPANGAQLMDALSQQWGSYFPQVFGQLAQDDKLPPSAIVIPNMSDPFAKETLARLSDPEAIKGLKERMPNGAETDINGKLHSLNDGFFGSLAYQDGGQKTYNTVVDQQRILAMGYVSQGKSVGDATKLAHEQTVGQYHFADTLRIPKTQLPDQVLAGTRVVTQKADMLDTQVPPSFRTGLKDSDRRAAWIDAIRSGATFVANGDETGATLSVRARNEAGRDALFAVRSSEGRPLSWSWSELRGLYTDQPGAASSDAALQKALAKGDRAAAEQIQRDRAAQRLRERTN